MGEVQKALENAPIVSTAEGWLKLGLNKGAVTAAQFRDKVGNEMPRKHFCVYFVYGNHIITHFIFMKCFHLIFYSTNFTSIFRLC